MNYEKCAKLYKTVLKKVYKTYHIIKKINKVYKTHDIKKNFLA